MLRSMAVVSGSKRELRGLRHLYCPPLFTCQCRRLSAARMQRPGTEGLLQTELQVLDQLSRQSMRRVFAYLVFDQLVAIDSEGYYKPQMLAGWDVSPDRLRHLPSRRRVEVQRRCAGCVGGLYRSIERWAKREGFGAQLMDAGSLPGRRSKTFVLKLKRPFAFVIEALSSQPSDTRYDTGAGGSPDTNTAVKLSAPGPSLS